VSSAEAASSWGDGRRGGGRPQRSLAPAHQVVKLAPPGGRAQLRRQRELAVRRPGSAAPHQHQPEPRARLGIARLLGQRQTQPQLGSSESPGLEGRHALAPVRRARPGRAGESTSVANHRLTISLADPCTSVA
jgi:hypothetical protein